MKVFCPEHQGIVEVSGDVYANERNILIENLVVECPICNEEVMINGVFDYDENGIPSEVF